MCNLSVLPRFTSTNPFQRLPIPRTAMAVQDRYEVITIVVTAIITIILVTDYCLLTLQHWAT